MSTVDEVEGVTATPPSPLARSGSPGPADTGTPAETAGSAGSAGPGAPVGAGGPAGPAAQAGTGAAGGSGASSGLGARRRRRWLGLAAVAAVVGGAATGTGLAFERAAAPEGPPPLGPGDVAVDLGIEHSLFEAGTIRVYEGTRVRFVLDNGDPIGHELIVGGPGVHAAHASGTHARHGSVAGEVSVGPNDRAMTTFQFDDPGEVEFACHLPGHYEYGMHGTIEVVARP